VGFNYPPIEHWLVPKNLFERTIEGVLPATQHRRESGALWLGAREKIAKISAVLFPQGMGVEERRYSWRVSPEVFGAVTRWAAPRSLCLLAVVHTHLPGVPSVLSWTDRAFGVRVPGVLAIVISEGGYETDYRRWGWYVFENSDYTRFSGSEIASRVTVRSLTELEWGTADANGVWT